MRLDSVWWIEALFLHLLKIRINDKGARMENVAPFFYDARVANPRMIVSLKCDRRAPYGLISRLLEELRKADALRINFATERER